jgi:hypothetical protein
LTDSVCRSTIYQHITVSEGQTIRFMYGSNQEGVPYGFSNSMAGYGLL